MRMLSWATIAGVWFFSFFASALFHFGFSLIVPITGAPFARDSSASFPTSRDTKAIAVRIVGQQEVQVAAARAREAVSRHVQNTYGVAKSKSKSSLLKKPAGFAGFEGRSPLQLAEMLEPQTQRELAPGIELKTESDSAHDSTDADQQVLHSASRVFAAKAAKTKSWFESCPQSEDLKFLDDFSDYEFFPRSYRAVIQFTRAEDTGNLHSGLVERPFELLEFNPEEAEPAQFIDRKLAEFFLSCLNAGYFRGDQNTFTAPGRSQSSAGRSQSSAGRSQSLPGSEADFLHEMKVIYTRTGVVVP